MIKLSTAIVALFAAHAVSAQSLSTTTASYALGTFGCPAAPVKHKFDDTTELGQALNLCEEHKHGTWQSMTLTSGVELYTLPDGTDSPEPSWAYDQGWEKCSVVYEKWYRTEAAKRERREAEEARIKAKRDYDFIGKVAKEVADK